MLLAEAEHLALPLKSSFLLPLPRAQAEGALVGSSLRKKAVAECMKHIHYEASSRAIPYNEIIHEPSILVARLRATIHSAKADT